MLHLRELCLLLVLVLGLAVSQTKAKSLKSQDTVVVCDICPDEQSISPCLCVCQNATVAQIKCGPELTSCEQLTAILNVATPVSQYLRLVVQDTNLKCILEKDIWGPTTFQEIIMRENNFCTMDNHAFVHFNSTLKVLNLEKNLLQNVCFSTLSDQPLVEKVYLGHNQIRFIPGEGSMALPQLKEIHLNNNLITSIQSNTFELMPRLELLDLSNNQISSLDRNAFTFQNRVSSSRQLHIKLSDNKIQTIPKDLVSGVENVTIDLQNNYIQALPEERYHSILENSNYKAKIMVKGNEISCDLGLCWIVQNKNITNCFDDFQCCNAAESLYGLTVDDLGCGDAAIA